jgi:protein SCO1/2
LVSCQQTPVFSGVDITDSTAFKAQINTKDMNNNVLDLNKFAQKSNSITLVTFGYTACPDYCPTTLAKIVQVEKLLTDKKNLQVIFITIDPKQDTKDILKEYLKAFNPKYIGISVDNNDLEQIKSNFKVISSKENGVINHTTGMYAIDSKGKIRLYLPYNLTAQQIALDIQKL